MASIARLAACLAATACLASGGVIVNTFDDHGLYRYNNSGVIEYKLSGSSYAGVTLGPDGRIYAANDLGEIYRWDGLTGAPLGLFAAGPTYPLGLGFSPNGDLYVGYNSQNEVRRYSGANGSYVGSTGVSTPYGFAFDSQGSMYVASVSGNSVVKFDSSGALVGDFIASGSGGLAYPVDPKFGPDGALYVASFSTNEIKVYNGTTGAYISTLSNGNGGLDGPNGLLFGPGGYLYVTSWNSGEILRYDTNVDSFFDVWVDVTPPKPNFLTYAPDTPEPAGWMLSTAGLGLLALTRMRRR